MVLKLSEDVHQLQKDNEYLKYNLNKITTSVPAPSVRAMKPSAQGPSTLPNDITPPCTTLQYLRIVLLQLVLVLMQDVIQGRLIYRTET
jgi:hypothetical protein